MPRAVRHGPPPSAASVLRRLRSLRNESNIAGMARFGISSTNTLGISVTTLRGIAKEIGRDHALAADLWASGIHEARSLACLIEEPGRVTSRQLDAWVRDIDSWDVCDGFASLVGDVPFAWRKVRQWARRRHEFVRRAAFSTIAAITVHDKTAPDQVFLDALPLIREAATDERNFVKKAVNWALRQIGKRNLTLNAAAIAEAERLRALDSPSARWIAADALRELRSDAVQARLREQAGGRHGAPGRRRASP